MTRLQPPDVAGIPSSLERFDRELLRRSGLTLRGLACRAARLDEGVLAATAASLTVRVVPMDCGQGLLAGFPEAVAAVAAHLGFRAGVTASSDAAGLAEAYEAGADLLLLADDRRFVAVDARRRRVTDNDGATGRGFAAGLEALAGGLRGREVLVIGCGPVGRAAARFLAEQGARLGLCDLRRERAETAARELASAPARAEGDLPGALRRYTLLLDATPAGSFIREDWLAAGAAVSAPGVPLGLTPEAARKVGDRLLHDPLQTGVAAMLAEAVRP